MQWNQVRKLNWSKGEDAIHEASIAQWYIHVRNRKHGRATADGGVDSHPE